ncbi:MAG TPA: hypothetical protein VFO62_04625 [Candidatus Binatia bacterium]|nr:hypothetical protein [Candidatus Binatia bacterium]
MRSCRLAALAVALVCVFGAIEPARAATGDCSQPVSAGAAPVATDCLFILNAAVGLQSCDPACICAPKGTLPTSATDALVCLNATVGVPVDLQCPCEPPTTSTSTTTTATITITSTTTTTDTSTTTSTVLVGEIEAGRVKYDSLCTFCHSAIPHDLVAEVANDLGGKGELLVLELGTINSEMEGYVLTEQELANLFAFLESL